LNGKVLAFQTRLKKWLEKVTTPEEKKMIRKYLNGVSAKKKGDSRWYRKVVPHRTALPELNRHIRC
jgi:hypothetical protein